MSASQTSFAAAVGTAFALYLQRSNEEDALESGEPALAEPGQLCRAASAPPEKRSMASNDSAGAFGDDELYFGSVPVVFAHVNGNVVNYAHEDWDFVESEVTVHHCPLLLLLGTYHCPLLLLGTYHCPLLLLGTYHCAPQTAGRQPACSTSMQCSHKSTAHITATAALTITFSHYLHSSHYSHIPHSITLTALTITLLAHTGCLLLQWLLRGMLPQCWAVMSLWGQMETSWCLQSLHWTASSIKGLPVAGTYQPGPSTCNGECCAQFA